MKKLVLFFITLMAINSIKSQNQKEIKRISDSLFIKEIEDKTNSEKVLHAEPLFVDLIRDLGARKGEKEWNVGIGLIDNGDYDKYAGLIEYEWAPINRLGLEVELPFSLYYPTQKNEPAPSNKLNSLKFATQYSFYVSEKHKTSMALGYIQEFELTDFDKYGKENLFIANVYNPFFVAAKRFGNNFHTLLYAGPSLMHYYDNQPIQLTWQINSNVHYMISGTRNFIGIEFNKTFQNDNFDMIVRPQMRVGIAHNLLIGIVTGIPISRDNERISTFLRLIYEPQH